MQQLVRHFGQTAVASSVGLSTFASKQKRDTTDRPPHGSRVLWNLLGGGGVSVLCSLWTDWEEEEDEKGKIGSPNFLQWSAFSGKRKEEGHRSV